MHKPLKCSKTDWALLRQIRSWRGWQLAAYALGYKPTAGLLRLLKGKEKSAERLKAMRGLIKKGASDNRAVGHLLYDTSSEQLGRQRNERNSPLEGDFDLVEFMEFVKSLPDVEVYASIPKQMKDAAAAWSAKDGEQSPALETRPIKAERESDRTSKINSISRLLTVFAVADYDYPPPSFKTDAADRARVTAITKMFKMTGDHGVNIDRATIKTRVEDAFKVPPVEELESLAQRAKQTIGDLK